MLPITAQLNEKQIKSLIEEAFAPLTCEIQFDTYNGVIKLSITSVNNEKVLQRHSLFKISQSKNESLLRSTLNTLRQDIEEMGYPLLPFSKPR